MDKYIAVLNRIFPFSYLTLSEKRDLINHSSHIDFKNGTEILKVDTEDNHAQFYILLKGSVSVIIGSSVLGRIEAPSYFGERSVFFHQPRKATIIADKDVSCLIVQKKYMHRLIRKNLNFCYAFASALRNKQNIFANYNEFINLLKRRKIAAKIQIVQLLDVYKLLSPILHKHCTTNEIDFPILGYVVKRFPEQLSSMTELVLALDLPLEYKQIQENIRIKTSVDNFRRKFYEVLPGRIFTVLRDDLTDYIDIITKLCSYVIEVKKITARLLTKPSVIPILVNHYYGDKQCKEQMNQMSDKLPFSAKEMKQLKLIYKDRLLDKLYELFSQNGEIQVRNLTAPVRYYSDISELWIEQINELLNKYFSYYYQQDQVDVHIISSNTHSVLNCISPWVHSNASALINREDYSELKNETDRLYAGIKHLLNDVPEMAREKKAMELKHGIYHLTHPSFTGINVSIINMSKLAKNIDPGLCHFPKQKNSLLFNIDYAYGKQAEPIIRNLILLFGKRIKSLSIIGKAGSLVGKRGDLMIPNQFIIQENDVVYPVTQADMKQDLIEHGWEQNIYSGPMLTVMGTLMQNSEMLWFYKQFWNAVGMEMEGGYYLQEIYRAMRQGLIDSDINLRFAYYVSDTPLDRKNTLATKLTLSEGLPAVYAITRSILKKIIENNYDQ